MMGPSSSDARVFEVFSKVFGPDGSASCGSTMESLILLTAKCLFWVFRSGTNGIPPRPWSGLGLGDFFSFKWTSSLLMSGLGEYSFAFKFLTELLCVSGRFEEDFWECCVGLA